MLLISEMLFSISNHERGPNTHVMRFLERHGIPYHYLVTTKDDKSEEEILDLVHDTDFMVLARYMQVNQIQSAHTQTEFSFTVKQVGLWKCVCARAHVPIHPFMPVPT